MINRIAKHGLLLVLCCTFVVGCERWQRDRVTFDGIFFRGSAKPVDRRDRTEFLATVRGVSASEDAAREALAYEGVKYCVRWFGISDIAWEIEPASDELRVEGDTLSVGGTCIE